MKDHHLNNVPTKLSCIRHALLASASLLLFESTKVATQCADAANGPLRRSISSSSASSRAQTGITIHLRCWPSDLTSTRRRYTSGGGSVSRKKPLGQQGVKIPTKVIEMPNLQITHTKINQARASPFPQLCLLIGEQAVMHKSMSQSLKKSSRFA